MAEQVSEGIFQALKDEIFRRFDSFDQRISELTGEIRMYSQTSQCQDREITLLKYRTEELEKEKIRISDKIEEQEESINEFKIEAKVKQRNLTIYFTIAALLISLLSNWDKIFK